MTDGTILVAMSGGVDSAVAAHRLKERGDAPVGVFMRMGASARHAVDMDNARRVAAALGIPLRVLDLARDFERLIDQVCAEYGRGRTPNPCILCNRDLKFGRLLEYAETVGAKQIATGHYARVEREAGRWRLKRGLDRTKDQSYVLFAIGPERLGRLRLPLGGLFKAEVRHVAHDLGLAARNTPESQDACFLTGTVGDLVRERRPDLVRPGPVLDLAGREVGRHEGVVHFTIGQRRGLGLAMGEPRYVVEIRAEQAAVVIGPAASALAPGLLAEQVLWHEATPAEPLRADVQIRYRHPSAPAWIEPLDAGRARVRFDRPQPAVTPGQAAVFYRDDRVLGGGWIERKIDPL